MSSSGSVDSFSSAGCRFGASVFNPYWTRTFAFCQKIEDLVRYFVLSSGTVSVGCTSASRQCINSERIDAQKCCTRPEEDVSIPGLRFLLFLLLLFLFCFSPRLIANAEIGVAPYHTYVLAPTCLHMHTCLHVYVCDHILGSIINYI